MEVSGNACDADEISRTCEGNVYEPTDRLIWPPAGSPCHDDGTCGEVSDLGCVWWLDGRDDYPINCIDWCDAAGYCKWAGKRLCGKASDLEHEFRIACDGAWSSGGPEEPSPWRNGAYASSDWDDLNACNFAHEDPYDELAPVGALKGCEGGYPGLFDLKGNVWEFTRYGHGFWARGGSFTSVKLDVVSAVITSDTNCSASRGLTPPSTSHDVGFRCCADALPEAP
jgi:formylglycine-generating enzyme